MPLKGQAKVAHHSCNSSKNDKTVEEVLSYRGL